MANESFDEFLRRGVNYNGGELEYFEDTHDAAGNYTGSRGFTPSMQSAATQPTFGAQAYTQPPVQQQQQYAQPQYAQPQPQPQAQPQYYTATDAARRTENDLSRPTQFKYTTIDSKQQSQAMPLPGPDQFISPRMYQNIAMYAPRTAADVSQLIDFLRRREPAIIDLDPIADSGDAQRILDFTAGAAYALGGSIISLKTNWFMIVPDGITIVRTESN